MCEQIIIMGEVISWTILSDYDLDLQILCTDASAYECASAKKLITY